MKRHQTVRVCVGDQQIQYEVTQSTTCRDILMSASVGECVSDNFAVYESAYGVEKMLPHNTKLLKHMRARGVNQNVVLNVRKVDVVMSKISKAKRKLRRLRTLLQRSKTDCDQRVDSFLLRNLDTSENVKTSYNKNIALIDDLASEPVLSCKMELMKRYLRDSVELNILQTRTPGDGIDEESHDVSRLPARTAGDGTDAVSATDFDSIIKAASDYDLDIAFMCNDDTICVDTVKQEARSGLNDCVLCDCDDGDKESAFGDDSDCSSICDLERNISELDVDDTVIKMEKIKSAFSNGDLNARITEDKLLDSFMNTFVAESSNDEGLSSVGSDFE